MKLTRLDQTGFETWEDYYRHYQYLLAKEYYLPLLAKWGFEPKGRKILDVGCGDGGFVSAFADQGAFCTGVEIRDFPWRYAAKLTFVVDDITSHDAHERLGSDFDLIILRDVIEHIPIARKLNFLLSLRKFANTNTRVLITFPPFYSPFGLHQQTLLKSFARYLPFLGWLPEPALKLFCRGCRESHVDIAKVLEIKNCRMTIGGFKSLLKQCELQPVREKYFTIRPSHEIRYGWRMLPSLIGNVPLLCEIFVLGTVYLLKFPGSHSESPISESRSF